MAEAVAQQMARLQLEVQNLQAQLQMRPSVTKDLSLVSLIPKWSGNDKAVPLQQFFEAIDDAARIGAWNDADRVKIATLRLTDSARAFYNASSELHEPDVTWAMFKATFQKRFRDVRTDQYHFTQLQMARQKKGETPQEFADRCRNLAQRTVPQVEDAALQKLYHEQAERMLLASFTSGLTGTPGRQVRFAMPKSVDEALKIAITVEQAERQERRDEAFYLRSHEQESNASGRVNRRDGGKARSQYSPHRQAQWRSREETTRNAGTREERRCYECNGIGHLARICPTRQSRQNSRNPPKENSANAPQQKPQGATPKARKNVQAPGKQARNGSSSFHISTPSNAANYHVVKVVTSQGAPTIYATILGDRKAFILDTGSNVSLIKPGVSHNKIRTTSLAPFGVTGDELEIKGEQEVEFCCNNQNYKHQFYVCSLPTDADGIIGMDFLLAVSAKLDLEKQELRMLKYKSLDYDSSDRRARGTGRMASCSALTVFSNSDGHKSK